jgi:hypothetical protein
LKSEIAGVIKQVAAKLRNTPAVCRKSYINPAVFTSWRSGLVHKVFNGSLSLAAPRKAESLVLAFLRSEAKSSDCNHSKVDGASANHAFVRMPRRVTQQRRNDEEAGEERRVSDNRQHQDQAAP